MVDRHSTDCRIRATNQGSQKGVYGIGFYQVATEAEMSGLLKNDPANGLLKYGVFEMPRAVVGTGDK